MCVTPIAHYLLPTMSLLLQGSDDSKEFLDKIVKHSETMEKDNNKQPKLKDLPKQEETDQSNVAEAEEKSAAVGDDDTPVWTDINKSKRLPDKMMCVLLNNMAPDAIWWMENGTSFAMQKEKFQTQILDKYFRGNKFKSMVRNLHRW